MKRFKEIGNEIKITRVQKILIALCAVILMFGVLTRVMQGNAASEHGYSAFSLFRYSLIDNPANSAKNFASDFSSLWEVKNQNDELRALIATQPMYKDERDEALRKVEEMEALMKLSSTSTYQSVNAKIMSRDVQGWSNIITIDKGSKDGIKKDRAVICSKGLIGRVVEVSDNSAKVKLLSTENGDNSVAIKVVLDDKTTSEGILEKFDKETNTYEVRLFDSNVKVSKGMHIVSSGIGGVFPSGIIIGEVTSVEDLYNVEGQTIMVVPSVEFNNFQYVSVLVEQ